MKILKIIHLSILFSGLNTSPLTRDTPMENSDGKLRWKLEQMPSDFTVANKKLTHFRFHIIQKNVSVNFEWL